MLRRQMLAHRIARRPAWADAGLTAVYGAVTVSVATGLTLRLAPQLRFEDALIVLRYARNLIEGQGFVYNPGERVLGVTSPLHTLVSMLWVWAGGEGAPALQNAAGVLCLAGCAGMLAVLGRCLDRPWLGLGAALACLADFTPTFLYLGMEVFLFALLVLLAAFLFLDDRELATGLVLGFAFVTRYDAALLAALVGGWWLVERRRVPWRLVLGFAVPVLPWLLFCQAYFGSIVPHALQAKRGFVPFGAYLVRVFWYTKEAFRRLLAVYVPLHLFQAAGSYAFPALLAAGAWRAVKRQRRWALLVAYPLLHLAVYAAIGADPGFTWHVWVLYPFALLLFALGVGQLADLGLAATSRLRPGLEVPARRLAAMVLALALGMLAVHAIRSAWRPYRADALTTELHEVAGWIREHYPPDTSLLHPAIGILGWETRLRIVDQAGLVTHGLHFFDDTHCTPLEEAVSRFRPDLVLVHADVPPDLDALGYAPVRAFHGALTYQLLARVPASATLQGG